MFSKSRKWFPHFLLWLYVDKPNIFMELMQRSRCIFWDFDERFSTNHGLLTWLTSSFGIIIGWWMLSKRPSWSLPRSYSLAQFGQTSYFQEWLTCGRGCVQKVDPFYGQWKKWNIWDVAYFQTTTWGDQQKNVLAWLSRKPLPQGSRQKTWTCL